MLDGSCSGQQSGCCGMNQTFILVAVVAARVAARVAAVVATTSRWVSTIVNMIGGVGITIVTWWQIGPATSSRRSCVICWWVVNLAHCIKILGSMRTNGGIFHLTISTFDCVGVFVIKTQGLQRCGGMASCCWQGHKQLKGLLFAQQEGGLEEGVLLPLLSQFVKEVLEWQEDKPLLSQQSLFFGWLAL